MGGRGCEEIQQKCTRVQDEQPGNGDPDGSGGHPTSMDNFKAGLVKEFSICIGSLTLSCMPKSEKMSYPRLCRHVFAACCSEGKRGRELHVKLGGLGLRPSLPVHPGRKRRALNLKPCMLQDSGQFRFSLLNVIPCVSSVFRAERCHLDW